MTDIVERLDDAEMIYGMLGVTAAVADEAIAEITTLRDALRFYRDEWDSHVPTVKLFQDEGKVARTALGERE